jgi:ACS family hexuronate transporter-like MFS transporter
VIAEWFPIASARSAWPSSIAARPSGSVVAPPLIIALQLRFGWQTTFLAVAHWAFSGWYCGCSSITRPTGTLASRPRRLALIREDPRSGRRSTAVARIIALPADVGNRALRAFCCDPVWWLYITWLPLYLY